MEQMLSLSAICPPFFSRATGETPVPQSLANSATLFGCGLAMDTYHDYQEL